MTPTSITAGQAFKCIAREYTVNKYHLYTEYTIPCSGYGSSTDKMQIRSIPSHILKTELFYEFIIY